MASATLHSSSLRSTCGISLTDVIYGHRQIHLQVTMKRLPKYTKVHAELDSGSDSSYQRIHQYLVGAANRNSENWSSPNNETDRSGDSSTLIEEGSNVTSFHRRERHYPLNSMNYQMLLHKLRAIHLHVLASEQWNASRLEICHRTYSVSATNLIHYMALHSLDVRQLKEELSTIGTLNLESINSHVLGSIIACIQLLENSPPESFRGERNTSCMDISDHSIAQTPDSAIDFSMASMRRMQSIHARALFGSSLEKNVHIMVTVGKEVIANEMLLDELLKAGADIIRINCAHDEPSIWSEIIRLAKSSSQKLEKPCRILMDLAGPKLRTGLLKTGPCVMKVSPKKDVKGAVVFPSQVWLSRPGCQPPTHTSPDAVLFVEGEEFLRELEAAKVLRFVDVRGRKRSLKLSKKYSIFNGCGYIAECSRTAYIESGTKLCIKGKKKKILTGQVVDVPPTEQFIRLHVGDLLTICRTPSVSGDAPGNGGVGQAKLICSSGLLFDSVKPGDPIAFDDGKVWGVIQGASINKIVVSITHASPKGSKLGSEKSINIPKSEMKFGGVTSKDLMDLEFIAANANMVGISFIRDVEDVVTVLQELKKRKLQDLGIVLKIETLSAFEKLPLLLLEAMQYPNPLGVMIARGDLAVECDWYQLASIQEEILSICGSAHVPVIWATQVLESLTKSGIPTRAEITDVTSGMRASCIMLNKGKYIVKAVSTLNSILHNCLSTNKKILLGPLTTSFL